MKFDISYISIDRDFPFSLDNLNNIELNYTSPFVILSNLYIQSTAMLSSVTANYTQIYNYNLMNNNYFYRQFVTPLSQNKIITFLTTLGVSCNGNDTWLTLDV